MGTMTIVAIATDVAREAGLTAPLTLFGPSEGDTTATTIKRAMEWTCRYLLRHHDLAGAVAGSVGKTAAGDALGLVFAADSDVAYCDDELLHLGTLWKVQHGDGLADAATEMEFRQAIAEIIWGQWSGEYESRDAGLPGP